MFSHCSSNNCLFCKKSFMAGKKNFVLVSKFDQVTGHWQVWQKVFKALPTSIYLLATSAYSLSSNTFYKIYWYLLISY